jgi:DNA repair exonuclease SbcCD ATPase subunit
LTVLLNDTSRESATLQGFAKEREESLTSLKETLRRSADANRSQKERLMAVLHELATVEKLVEERAERLQNRASKLETVADFGNTLEAKVVQSRQAMMENQNSLSAIGKRVSPLRLTCRCAMHAHVAFN